MTAAVHYAAQPPLPPAVYRQARKRPFWDEPVWVWSAIVELGGSPCRIRLARLRTCDHLSTRSRWEHGRG